MKKVKSFFGKLWRGIKKPFGFIKRKTEPAREFMKTGRAGGMIAELFLAVAFMFWIFDGMTNNKLPWLVMFLVTTIILLLSVGLLNLILKIIFGAGKRCKLYFFVAFFSVCANNLIGNMFHAIILAILMSFLLTLSVDVLGRCIWSFIKSRKFKQVFAYVVTVLSIAYIGYYISFFFNDNFGKSRVDFYSQIPVANSEQVSGFDGYLENGQYKVAALTYGPESSDDLVTETLDYTVFDSVRDRGGFTAVTDLFIDYDFKKVPVKGKIWYPEGESDCPVFFMVHGNHDSNIPSYLGYEYLGEYLASNGYVVVSVDENIINATGEGNDKRAILLLDNMKFIFEQNKLDSSILSGLIDEDKVAIGGHSRGGEMVAAAYLFNDLEAYPEDGNIKFDYHFNITSIVAISPVVDQYMPVSHSVEISDVNYLLIHGANDQDVSSMMGEKQYNNVTFSYEEKDTSGKNSEDKDYLKSSVYILGANHGQFNSLWGRYDLDGASNHYLNTNYFIDEADQKLIAKAYIRAFLDSTLGIDDTYESLLSDISGYRSYLPKTVYITNYSDSDFIDLVTFDDTVDIANFESGASVECTGTDTWTIAQYARGDGGEGENYVFDCSWEKGSEPVVEVTFPEIDISNGCISFEVADLREDTEKLQEGLKYSVELEDTSGKTVTVENPVLVYHSLAVQLYKQEVLAGKYEYKHQLQRVAIEPSMFGDAKFDYSKVVAMRIITDGTDAGELLINNIGYWSE